MTHFIYIPFTGVGLYGGYRGDVWFAERVAIFDNYTLKSLAAQTNPNFTVWVSFRPQEFGHPMVTLLEELLDIHGIKCVFTYDGLMYHDDKFGGSPFHKLKNALRVIRGCYRNNTWRDLSQNLNEIFTDKNEMLPERLMSSLKVLKPYVSGNVLMTRLDSDDLLHKEAVQRIQNIALWREGAVAFRGGYILNAETGRVAEYNPTTNPPFHTLYFEEIAFLQPLLHWMKYRDFKSHEDVDRIFKPHIIRDRMYCVVTHNPELHISTGFDHPFRGRHVDRVVLEDFGL